eukprot:10541320-Karenia_brevis.AAC.1
MRLAYMKRNSQAWRDGHKIKPQEPTLDTANASQTNVIKRPAGQVSKRPAGNADQPATETQMLPKKMKGASPSKLDDDRTPSQQMAAPTKPQSVPKESLTKLVA